MQRRVQVQGRIRWLLIGPFLVAVALLVLLAVASVDSLSAVRAYVGGEGVWAQGQKDAVFQLGLYIDTRDPADYRRFQAALTAPWGDRQARLALEQDPPDLPQARRGFLDGGVHPDDIDGMVTLFLRFGHVGYMAEAVAIWAAADQDLEALKTLAQRVNERVEAGDTDSPELQALVAGLPALGQRLDDSGRRFAAKLGEASRMARRLMLAVTLLLAAGLVAAAIFLTAYMLNQQRRTERALRDSNERWALAADASGMGLFEWDLRTGRVKMDGQAAHLNGLPPVATEIDAATLSDTVVHPDDVARSRASMRQCIAHPAPVTMRFRVKLKQGAVRHLESVTSVRCDKPPPDPRHGGDAQGGVYMVGILRDVSDEVQAAQLQLDKEATERAYRAKGEFLSRVSHELRTPLNAVLGFTELVQTDDTAPLTKLQRQRLQHVFDAGRRLLTLVNDVLDLSCLDEAHATPPTRPLLLAPVLQACLKQIEPVAQAQHVVIEQQVPADVLVWAEAESLEQVFANLLSNAVNYNRPGGWVKLSCKREGGELLVTVRDTGAGLSPEQVAQLFQPFNRLGAEFSKVQGNGLGLAIAQRLLKRMGGQLAVESSPGIGTSVVVRLKATA